MRHADCSDPRPSPPAQSTPYDMYRLSTISAAGPPSRPAPQLQALHRGDNLSRRRCALLEAAAIHHRQHSTSHLPFCTLRFRTPSAAPCASMCTAQSLLGALALASFERPCGIRHACTRHAPHSHQLCAWAALRESPSAPSTSYMARQPAGGLRGCYPDAAM